MKAGKHSLLLLVFLLPTALKDHLWERVPVLRFLKLTEGATKTITVVGSLQHGGGHTEASSPLLLAKATQGGPVSRLETGDRGSDRRGSTPRATRQQVGKRGSESWASLSEGLALTRPLSTFSVSARGHRTGARTTKDARTSQQICILPSYHLKSVVPDSYATKNGRNTHTQFSPMVNLGIHH